MGAVVCAHSGYLVKDLRVVLSIRQRQASAVDVAFHVVVAFIPFFSSFVLNAILDGSAISRNGGKTVGCISSLAKRTWATLWSPDKVAKGLRQPVALVCKWSLSRQLFHDVQVLGMLGGNQNWQLEMAQALVDTVGGRIWSSVNRVKSSESQKVWITAPYQHWMVFNKDCCSGTLVEFTHWNQEVESSIPTGSYFILPLLLLLSTCKF